MMRFQCFVCCLVTVRCGKVPLPHVLDDVGHVLQVGTGERGVSTDIQTVEKVEKVEKEGEWHVEVPLVQVVERHVIFPHSIIVVDVPYVWEIDRHDLVPVAHVLGAVKQVPRIATVLKVVQLLRPNILMVESVEEVFHTDKVTRHFEVPHVWEVVGHDHVPVSHVQKDAKQVPRIAAMEKVLQVPWQHILTVQYLDEVVLTLEVIKHVEELVVARHTVVPQDQEVVWHVQVTMPRVQEDVKQMPRIETVEKIAQVLRQHILTVEHVEEVIRTQKVTRHAEVLMPHVLKVVRHAWHCGPNDINFSFSIFNLNLIWGFWGGGYGLLNPSKGNEGVSLGEFNRGAMFSFKLRGMHSTR